MDAVTYEVEDRVAVVTIDRPDKRNAMSPEVFEGLREAAERAGKDAQVDRGVGAVLVRGAGGVFSAGIDVSTLGGQMEEGGSLSIDFVTGLQQSFTAFEDLDVPTVAAVEGFCFGAGLQLAIACHVRLTTPDAQFSLMERRWGLVPDLGGPTRLPRLVGAGRATEIALTARRFDGEEALAMGLCEVPLRSDDPTDEAFRWARDVAHGPGAIRRVPRLVRENLARPRDEALRAEAAVQAEVTQGPDFREAVTAGMQGREPDFLGR